MESYDAFIAKMILSWFNKSDHTTQTASFPSKTIKINDQIKPQISNAIEIPKPVYPCYKYCVC